MGGRDSRNYRFVLGIGIAIGAVAAWAFFVREEKGLTGNPQIIWKYESKGFLTIRHIDSDRVFCSRGVASMDGNICVLTCLNRNTGVVLWSLQHTNWEQGHSFSQESFCMGVVESSRNLFVQRATSDGSKHWEIEASGEVVWSVMGGGMVWYIMRDGKVFGLDATSGKTRWTNNLSPPDSPRNFGTLGEMVYREGMLLIDAHLSNDYTHAADKRKLVVEATTGELLAEFGPWPCWLAGSSLYGFGAVSNHLQRWDLKQRQLKADVPMLPDAGIVTISEADVPGKLVIVYQDWTNTTPRMQIFDANGNNLTGPLPECCHERISLKGRHAVFKDRARGHSTSWNFLGWRFFKRYHPLPQLVSAFDLATGKQLWATNCGAFQSWAYDASDSHFAYVNDAGSIFVRSMTNGILLQQARIPRPFGFPLAAVTCDGEDVMITSENGIMLIRSTPSPGE